MSEISNSARPLDVPSRQGRLSRIVQVAANFATIAVSILLSIVLVRVFLLPPPPSSAVRPDFHPTGKGTSLKTALPDIDWAKNHRTLIFALSTQCHFCTDSLPFFQRITKASGCHVKTVALVPQDKVDGKEYLNKGGVQVDEVRQVKLDSIGINGTPTLLLVDETGKVAEVWQGKLPPEQEAEVLAVLKMGAPQ